MLTLKPSIEHDLEFLADFLVLNRENRLSASDAFIQCSRKGAPALFSWPVDLTNSYVWNIQDVF